MVQANQLLELNELIKQRKPTALPKPIDKIKFNDDQKLRNLIGNGK